MPNNNTTVQADYHVIFADIEQDAEEATVGQLRGRQIKRECASLCKSCSCVSVICLLGGAALLSFCGTQKCDKFFWIAGWIFLGAGIVMTPISCYCFRTLR